VAGAVALAAGTRRTVAHHSLWPRSRRQTPCSALSLRKFGGGGRLGSVFIAGLTGCAGTRPALGHRPGGHRHRRLADFAFAALGARLLKGTEAITVPSALPHSGDVTRPLWQRVLILLGSIALPFALWWALLAALLGAAYDRQRPGRGLVSDYWFVLPSAAAAQVKLLAGGCRYPADDADRHGGGARPRVLLALTSQVRPGIVRALLPVVVTLIMLARWR